MAKTTFVTDDRGNRVATDVTSDDGRTTERWSYPGNSVDSCGSFQGTFTHRSDGSTSWKSKEDGERSSLGQGKYK